MNTAYPFNSISGSFSDESLEIKKQAVGKPASFPYPLRKRFSNIPDQSASSCLDEDNIKALLIHSMVQHAYRIQCAIIIRRFPVHTDDDYPQMRPPAILNRFHSVPMRARKKKQIHKEPAFLHKPFSLPYRFWHHSVY